MQLNPLVLDPELDRDMTALIADPTSEDARLRVRGAIDHWLLRTTRHRIEVGRQLVAWFVGAAQSVDMQSNARGQAALAALEPLYGFRPMDAVDSLKSATSWSYAAYVSGPNPASALKASGEYAKPAFQAMLAAGTMLAGDVDTLADGKDCYAGFWYFTMPFRAAFMRALLFGYAQGSPALDELVKLSMGGASTIPTTGLSVSPNMLLALVITEALDDDTAKTFVDDGGPRKDYAREAQTHTAAGDKLKELIRNKLMPPSGCDETAAAEPALRAFSMMEWGAPGEELRDSIRVAPVSLAGTTRIRSAKPPPFDAIVVPGFTALATRQNPPAISGVGVLRLRKAIQDFSSGLAPFILVSGGPVYPLGTHLTEAQFMFDFLTSGDFREGDDKKLPLIPPERVILDGRARHSTTNLRNATRILQRYRLDGPYLITTGGDQLVAKETTDAIIAGGMMLGAQATAGLVTAATGDLSAEDQARAIGLGVVGNFVASMAVMGGVLLPMLDDQGWYFQSPFWSTYNGRCQDELGYRPHLFIGDPSEFCTYATSGPYGANAEKIVPGALRERIRARFELNRDIYEKLDKDMHAVMIPHPDRCQRFNIRDPLDP